MTTHQTERITARVEYAKRGRLRFIGHLDTTRALVRAVRAARLPARTTRGHSPHVEAAFGPPLPLGVTGESEFFDVRLTELVDPAAARDALQAHLPDGIEVRSVRLVVGDAESLGTSLNRADYSVEVPTGVPIAPDAIEQFLASDEVIVVRTRGGREKAVNVRRFVEQLEATHEPDGPTRLKLTIVMTPRGSASAVEVLTAVAGLDAARHPGVRIHRDRVYHASGGAPLG